MNKLLSLALGLCFGTLAGLGASSQTVPQYTLVSSNATVTFVTNTANLILDLTAVVPASTNSGNWQAIGTNSANLAPEGGTATMPFGAVGTNYVGYQKFTNGFEFKTGSFINTKNGVVWSNDVSIPLQIGSGEKIGAPTNAVTLTNDGVGILNGVYIYAYTEYDGYGETDPSPLATNTAALNSVLVTTGYPRAGTGGRKLYRTDAGGTQLKFLYDFGGGDHWHQIQYIDNIADGALGTNAPVADGTQCYQLQVTKGVKFFRTNPNTPAPCDLTMLTGDPGTAGALSMDLYDGLLVRNILGVNYASLHTGNSGGHFFAEHQQSVAPVTWTAVFNMMAGGSIVSSVDGTDGTVYPFHIVTGPLRVDAGGQSIIGNSEIVGTLALNGPTITDSTLNIASPGANGQHAIIRATKQGTGDNGIFWGMDSTNYQSSLGWSATFGDPIISFYGYQSTNINNTAYSGTLNRLSQIRAAHTSADLVYEFAPLGTADTDATLSQGFRMFNGGGSVVGDSLIDPGFGSMEIKTNLVVTYGYVEVQQASLHDSAINTDVLVGNGLHAAIRTTGSRGANNVFWGHPTTDYLSSFGHNSGSGDAQLMFYCYGSTNANKQSYSGTVNAPSMIQADITTGLLSFYGAAAGAANTDITWTKGLTVNPLLSSLSYSYATNLTSLASSTAVAQVLSGTNTEFIGGITASGAAITNGMTVNTNSLYVTNNAVGIGTVVPSHVLHIVTATNDAVGIDSTGTDSNSMLHIQNTTVQGPFFDFHAVNDRYGFGVASGGAFDIRHSAVGTDPVNGTNVLTLDAAGVATVATINATNYNLAGSAFVSSGGGNVNLTGHLVEGVVDITTLTSGSQVNTNAITTGSLAAITNVTTASLTVTNAATAGSLSTQTNVTSAEIVATNGMTLNGTRITSWPSGGGGIAQTVSNNIVASGLIAVDATKTNVVAPTLANLTNTANIFDGNAEHAFSGAGTMVGMPCVVGGAMNFNINVTTPIYLPLFGGQNGSNPQTGTNYANLWPVASTLSSLYVSTSVTIGAGTNISYTIYTNGVASSLTVTLTSASQNGSDTTHSVNVEAGCKINAVIQANVAAGTQVHSWTLLSKPQ